MCVCVSGVYSLRAKTRWKPKQLSFWNPSCRAWDNFFFLKWVNSLYSHISGEDKSQERVCLSLWSQGCLPRPPVRALQMFSRQPHHNDPGETSANLVFSPKGVYFEASPPPSPPIPIEFTLKWMCAAMSARLHGLDSVFSQVASSERDFFPLSPPPPPSESLPPHIAFDEAGYQPLTDFSETDSGQHPDSQEMFAWRTSFLCRLKFGG